MKKSTKILVLTLVVALLSCLAVGFSVSAETTAPEVVAKNIEVNGNFCLMFAVDPATVAGDDVTLKIYDKAPADGVEPIQTITKAKTETENIALDGNTVAVIVFHSMGVSAKDIADTWWFTAESAGVVSAVDTYSVREYAFERLYADNKVAATDTYGIRQKKFYLSILEVGSNAQDLLVNTKLEEKGETPERLANQYAYAAIQNGTFGAAAQQFVEIGDTLTLTPAAGFKDPSWKVYTYGTNGVLVDTKIVDLGSTFTVAGNTVVVPGWNEGLTPGKYFRDLGNAKLNFNDVTFADTGLYTNLANKSAQNKYGNYSFADVEGRGQVLNLKKDGVTEIGGGAIRVPVVDKANGNGNCLVAEFDFKFDGSFEFYNNEYKTEKFIGTAINIVLGLSEASVDESYSWKAAGTATKQISSSALYMIDETATKTGSNVIGGEYASFSNSYGSTARYGLECDKWYNICIEWYDSSSENRTYVKAYVDGELFYTTYGSLTTSNTTSNVEEYDYNHVYEAKTFKLTLQDRFRPSDVQLDNLFVGIIAKEYTAK